MTRETLARAVALYDEIAATEAARAALTGPDGRVVEAKNGGRRLIRISLPRVDLQEPDAIGADPVGSRFGVPA